MEFILPKETKEVPVDGYKRYDLLIIGAGPAGMTAAVYAARKKLDTLVASKDVGGQTILASGVETYMGYQYISGAELTDAEIGGTGQAVPARGLWVNEIRGKDKVVEGIVNKSSE